MLIPRRVRRFVSPVWRLVCYRCATTVRCRGDFLDFHPLRLPAVASDCADAQSPRLPGETSATAAFSGGLTFATAAASQRRSTSRLSISMLQSIDRADDRMSLWQRLEAAGRRSMSELSRDFGGIGCVCVRVCSSVCAACVCVCVCGVCACVSVGEQRCGVAVGGVDRRPARASVSALVGAADVRRR